jgi:hypothetical protein
MQVAAVALVIPRVVLAEPVVAALVVTDRAVAVLLRHGMAQEEEEEPINHQETVGQDIMALSLSDT